LALALATFLGAGSAAFAQSRVALVIGNARYEHAGVLANTINDANAIAALLTKAGFDFVDQRSNLGVVEFKRALREFIDRSRNADVAVVYYSGHGLEVGGVNYLIPVDAKLTTALDMDDEAVSLDRLLSATGRVKKLSLIILDACRENPFHPSTDVAPTTRAVSMGLAGITPTVPDMLIAFAAKAGSVSYDGDGPNSPFTTALVKYIAQPGLDIRLALGKVRDDVLRATGNRQEPYVYGSLGGGDVALVPAKPAASAAAGEPAASVDRDEASDYRMAERVGSIEGWRAFLSVHSKGFYAELARAQVQKMASLGATNAPAAAEVPKNPATSSPQSSEGAETRPAQPPSAMETAALTPDEICKRDEDRLARLRGGASADEAKHFGSELSCEKLRPQYMRLLESLGFASPAPLAPANSPSSNSSPTGQIVKGDCASQQVALDRLRAEPSPEATRQFWRDLQCEELRPQVRLLMESFNLAPEPLGSANASGAADQRASAGPAPAARNGTRGLPASITSSAADPHACDREAAELNRIRAKPDLSDAERFARSMTCDALKSEVARLLESIGE
jgi:uncharacterized caspase-like protein